MEARAFDTQPGIASERARQREEQAALRRQMGGRSAAQLAMEVTSVVRPYTENLHRRLAVSDLQSILTDAGKRLLPYQQYLYRPERGILAPEIHDRVSGDIVGRLVLYFDIRNPLSRHYHLPYPNKKILAENDLEHPQGMQLQMLNNDGYDLRRGFKFRFSEGSEPEPPRAWAESPHYIHTFAGLNRHRELGRAIRAPHPVYTLDAPFDMEVARFSSRDISGNTEGPTASSILRRILQELDKTVP